MALNFNRVLIAGNLTRDVESRTVGDKAVAQFALAINHKWKGADGATKEETTFVDVECWGRTAELCSQYLSKGRGCFVEGRLKLDRWETANGEKRQRLKVSADSVQFTTAPRDGANAGSSPAADAGAPRAPAPAADGNDDPPF